MIINNYELNAKKYADSGNAGTAFLAFRDIPFLIKKHGLTGTKTLDYGCGTGHSSSFLRSLELDVQGVDISKDMLKEALLNDESASYCQIQSAQLPFRTNAFDFVFSSFVMFEISTKTELISIFKEIFRVLKKNGVFIFITGSEELYSREWLSLHVNFPQNKCLKSGDIGAVLLKDVNLIVYDYFWTHEDYNEVINSTPFHLIETLFPIGTKLDGYDWKDEYSHPPYSIYVLGQNDHSKIKLRT